MPGLLEWVDSSVRLIKHFDRIQNYDYVLEANEHLLMIDTIRSSGYFGRATVKMFLLFILGFLYFHISYNLSQV